MKIIENELVTFFDIDNTLVMETDVLDPLALKYLDVAGNICYGRPHLVHIDQLKKHKARGYTNILWSGNGYKHVEIIIKLLGIEEYVDIAMSKPVKYWDDLEDANNILNNRVYLKEK